MTCSPRMDGSRSVVEARSGQTTRGPLISPLKVAQHLAMLLGLSCWLWPENALHGECMARCRPLYGKLTNLQETALNGQKRVSKESRVDSIFHRHQSP